MVKMRNIYHTLQVVAGVSLIFFVLLNFTNISGSVDKMKESSLLSRSTITFKLPKFMTDEHTIRNTYTTNHQAVGFSIADQNTVIGGWLSRTGENLPDIWRSGEVPFEYFDSVDMSIDLNQSYNEFVESDESYDHLGRPTMPHLHIRKDEADVSEDDVVEYNDEE